MKTIQINEIEGFQIGSAQDIENATGCTVILCKEGARAGVDRFIESKEHGSKDSCGYIIRW